MPTTNTEFAVAITSTEDFPVHSLTKELADTLEYLFIVSTKNSQAGTLAIGMMNGLHAKETLQDETVKKLLEVQDGVPSMESTLFALAELNLGMNEDNATINGKQVTRKVLLGIAMKKMKLKIEAQMVSTRPLANEARSRAALMKEILPSLFKKVLLPALNKVDLSDD